MEPYVGQIIAVGFNYAPANWAICNGATLTIASNPTLFAVIGAAYGGDGQTTFALPDLRGRVPIGEGTSPGLPNFPLGSQGGSDTVTLSALTEPVHTHTLMASSLNGTIATPSTSAAIAINNTQTAVAVFGAASATPVSLSPAAITNFVGGGMPHENRQPFTTINYLIATTGLFPTAS